jgi:hypothetical protein
MSFARTNYDSCCYQSTVKQSTDPCSYMLGVPKSCNPCFVADPTIRASKNGNSVCQDKELIDVDSELMGLNYKHTHCSEKMYQFNKDGWCKLTNSKNCDTDNFLGAESTRISNGPSTLRCKGWNRWAWLPCDSQDHVFNLPPFQRLDNTKIMAKDQHRAVIPKLLNQTLSLPQFNENDKKNKIKTNVYTLENNMPSFIEFNNLRTENEIKNL